MNDKAYEYLFNTDNKLVHHTEAVRLGDYKMYPGDTEYLYTYKAGDQRQYFVLKKTSSNPFAKISSILFGTETTEHYNTKMKIAHELKYFDTVFNQEILFDEIIPERYFFDQKKKPDLSCYQNGKLVACIEIYNTSKKSNEDIEKLKDLDCLIIEIDINNENRCEHIALPKVFEFYKRELDFAKSESRRVEAKLRNVSESAQDELSELKAEYNKSAEDLQKGLSEIVGVEEQIKTGSTFRVQRIVEWLQKRIPRDSRKQYIFEATARRIGEFKNRIEEIRIGEINSTRSPEFRREITVTQSGISKIVEEIKRIEAMLRFRRTRIGHEETKMQRGF